MRFHECDLNGRVVCLSPINRKDKAALEQASADPQIWTFNPVGNDSKKAFEPWFEKAIAEHSCGESIVYTVKRPDSKKVIGTTRIYDVSHRHKRLQVGYTWYHPDVWGTSVNKEAKLLLLTHAFEVMGMNRVGFSVDARNSRSLKALESLGATNEGTLRQNMVLSDGFVRDTVVLSIVKEQWPRVCKALEEKIERYSSIGNSLSS